jgi:UDP-4-amino-4,6-dideoxy-N-acetyl-beta-L-altrosamine N-acetyltransferase
MILTEGQKILKLDVENAEGIKLINFVDLTDVEKISVLRWRNHDAIRQWMYRPELISLDEHLNFIASLRQREDKQYFLVRAQDDYLGVIDFVNIDFQQGTCDFGLYANPEIKIPHIGRQLIFVAIAYAFNALKLHTLHLEVFSNNLRAIKLYQRFNFSVLEHKKLDGKNILRLSLHHSKSLIRNI